MRYYTLEHLPRQRRAHLQDVVRVIRESVPVEMIILFGSYAYGDWVEDPEAGYVSDFDILVIVESATSAADHAFWENLQHRARSLPGDILVNVIAHDIHDVNRQLEKGSDFFREIVEDGIVLYDSGRHSLPTHLGPRAGDSPDGPDARARFHWHFQRANRWLEDFDTEMHGRGDLNFAAFKLHQAAEAYFKTVLRTLTGAQLKQHDLHALGYRCSELNPAFRDILPRSNAEEKQRLRLLDRAYRDARYEMSYNITRQDLEILAVHVRALGKLVEAVCRESL